MIMSGRGGPEACDAPEGKDTEAADLGGGGDDGDRNTVCAGVYVYMFMYIYIYI